MNPLKLVNVVLILLLQISVLNADWDSSYITIESPNITDVLNDSEFKALECKVCEYLKNSWCSQEKAKLLLELIAILKPKVCVEVGAFTGSSTLPILTGLNYNEYGYAFVIDPWSSEEATRGLPPNEENTIWWANLNMDALKFEFDKMIALWSLDSIYYELRMPSTEAASYVSTIDFLHLDGNFSEEGAFLDSEIYSSKVAPGGYILLSNALLTIGGKPSKMKALKPLFERCSVVCELDGGNTLLFRKK